MKTLLITALTCLTLTVIGQISNDCAETPTIINQCGTSFSISQATMKLATTDQLCQSGGSCPQYYVNATVYQNLDCDATVYPGQSLGGDASISIDNSLFWQFTSNISCNYTVSTTATNCCCKTSGPSNGAQIQIYGISSTLPGGTIQTYYGGNSGFINTYTQTIAVIANQPILILIDGINGSDCDISITVTPDASCGCTILPIELLEFKGYRYQNSNFLKWSTASEINNDFFQLERSRNCVDWETISTIPGAGNTSYKQDYSFQDKTAEVGINYYRLKQVDYNGESKTYQIIYVSHDDASRTMRCVNMLGVEVPIETPGIKILIYSDGEIKKIVD